MSYFGKPQDRIKMVKFNTAVFIMFAALLLPGPSAKAELPVAVATPFNASFHGGPMGFWDQSGVPAGWISSDPSQTYTAATGFIQVPAGVVVANNTGQQIVEDMCYELTVALGGDSETLAVASLVATEHADGSGKSIELVHVSRRAEGGYELSPTKFVSEPVPADLRGYYLRVECSTPRAGRGYFGDISVRSTRATSRGPAATAAVSKLGESDEKFVLVEEGKAAATIVVSSTPTVAALFAAKEFQDHVEKMTGAKLPISRDSSQVTGQRVLIGVSAATDAYDLRIDELRDLEQLIQFEDQTLILVGKDKPDLTRLGYPADLANASLPGWFDQRGTLNAVYDFLEQYCGVRWYHPTDIGTVIPRTATLAVDRKSMRRQQDMISLRSYFHATFYLPEYRDQLPGDEVDVWRLRMRMGGHPVQIDHSFYDYYDRFLDQHPDWFAQGFDPALEPPQLCYTNPQLIQQVVRDARDYFDGKYLFDRFPMSALPAGSDYFPLVPMDDMRWCQCEECQAYFDEPTHGVSTAQVFSSGQASNYIWHFVNEVAKEVHKTHPDKYVAALAYQQFADYPSQMDLEPNIAVTFCLWNQRGWHIPMLKKVEMDILDDWTSHDPDRPMFTWSYFMNPMAYSVDTYEPFPYFFGRMLIDQMQYFHTIGIKGMWMAQSSEMGFTHLYDFPDLYLAHRLGENAQLDGEQMLDEFFTLYYGAAAEPMRKLYDSLEATYTNPDKYPSYWLDDPNVRLTEEIAWGYLGTPERMKEWQRLVDEAGKLAQTPMEKQRLDWFIRGIWNPMLKGAVDHALIAERSKQTIELDIPRAKQSYGGDASRVDWELARDIGTLSSLVGIPNPSIERDISIKLIHDGQWLYIQHLDNVDPSLLDSGTPFGAKTFTDPLFFDSLVFMAAPQSRQTLRAIHVFGVDSRQTDYAGSGESDATWKQNWRGVSDMSMPDHWRVWITVPLDDLVPGGAESGTTFRANFYRYFIAPKGGWLIWSPHFNMDRARNPRYMGEMTLE